MKRQASRYVRGSRPCILLALALAAACSQPRAPTSTRSPTPKMTMTQSELDAFETLGAWSVQGSDGVTARIAPVSGTEGNALGLEFDFNGHAGHASAQRALPLELPANYALSFDLRGDAPPNDFQLKLLDESGENVWWFRRADFEFPKEWRRMLVKKRHIEFAWGPTADRELRRAARLELVIAAGKGGGRGTVAIDRLQLHALPLPPATPPLPVARASSSLPGAEPALALDGRGETAWRSAPGARQTFELDFGTPREFGGLFVRWKPGAHASAYDIELSDDGAAWRAVHEVRGAQGGRNAVQLPESEARYLRLSLHAGPQSRYELAELVVKDLDFGATPSALIAELARDSPRGRYPRGFLGEQPYWTLVGVDGAQNTALVSEDGALEVGKAGFSIEPFVLSRGTLKSWADVALTQSLRDGYLPLPSVTWRDAEWQLTISTFATGEPSSSELAARYELENLTKTPLELALVLAVRPFQVNPPTQFLNVAGGVSPIRALSWNGAALGVNGRRAVVPLTLPDHVGLSSFYAAGFPDAAPPAAGRAPVHLDDPTGLASAALVYSLRLAPGARVALGVLAPLGSAAASDAAPRVSSLAGLDREEQRVRALWRAQLNHVSFSVPAEGQVLIDTLRSSLAHILMSREGPILKPGTRSYARSWIRDGAMMSESLLRLGHTAAAAEYLAWYAPYQFENGKVPCCVDARGADPVPENDSAGQFIFLAGEIYRFTRDRALLERTWPAIEAAATYMESLRQSERGTKNLTPGRRAFFGLMPPSISHEGYSDKPAYSYWDNFWALIGYQEATEIAEALGQTAARERLSAQRDAFRKDVYASLGESTRQHGVTFLPGAADRGDFDPTSTTIALAPGREGPYLPKDLLLPTFERYWKEFGQRERGSKAWDVYTPYELRVVGTFVRLGWRDRAQALLAFFLKDRRPPAWNQWAEVVGREPRKPRFIGDMPHAWIASDYIRSVLDLFVYARLAEQSLVLAAGVPLAWCEGSGVRLENLRTPYGQVSYSMARRRGQIVLEVRGSEPRGGFVLPWAGEGAPPAATVNGKPQPWQDGELRFHSLPARIIFDRP